jgi:hypothetical protein
MRWAEHVAHDVRSAYVLLVGKLEGKRPLESHRYRCEDNVMDLREIGWEGVDWIYLA